MNCHACLVAENWLVKRDRFNLVCHNFSGDRCGFCFQKSTRVVPDCSRVSSTSRDRPSLRREHRFLSRRRPRLGRRAKRLNSLLERQKRIYTTLNSNRKSAAYCVLLHWKTENSDAVENRQMTFFASALSNWDRQRDTVDINSLSLCCCCSLLVCLTLWMWRGFLCYMCILFLYI